MNMEYHVAKHGNDSYTGSIGQPFQTIGRAAAAADPGDTVIVHEGTYREWVKPARGGLNELSRITYQAAPGEKVIIKGSERVTDWEATGSGVWKAVLPNAFFGDYNPFAETLAGDWFVTSYKHAREGDWPARCGDNSVHAGDVYLNGRSFYEAYSLEEVRNPKRREIGFPPMWSKRTELLLDPDGSVYQWYAEVDETHTTIYANFHSANPNEELAEINVRKCCFYPGVTGVNYITVRGFEIAQAACPWTPPTADQPGMLGAHWSKGWIIEDNILHNAKCSAISIGKEASTGDNVCTRFQRKPGYQNQMEAVFNALQIGWSKEKTGSHIIRNNTIYDCGQNGIVGHMGGAFSTIEHNHIYNIAVKHEYFGFEIAGIKLHAAVDVIIRNNCIHHCTLGTWLDWQAQGTRVSGNVLHDNDRDFFIEVTHGPCLVDNNIFASPYSIDNAAQGTAFVHNLIAGSMRRITVPDRSTPYHRPHTTQIAATTVVYGGDDRFYNNFFVGASEALEEDSCVGTSTYNGSPESMEDYQASVVALGTGDLEKFMRVPQPVYIHGNVYAGNAEAFDKETDNCVMPGFSPALRVQAEGRQVLLEMNVAGEMLACPTRIIDTKTLGMPRITECPYDAPDGGAITLDEDINGAFRTDMVLPGPIAQLEPGVNRILVWE